MGENQNLSGFNALKNFDAENLESLERKGLVAYALSIDDQFTKAGHDGKGQGSKSRNLSYRAFVHDFELGRIILYTIFCEFES